MKATELRIGNYYDENGVVKQVNPNTILNVFEDERSWCKPIPLTEEWLIRFGFEYRTDTPYNGWYSSPILGESIRIFEIENGWFKYHSSLNVIKYVHQLQNLYFALTGEELTIK